MVKTNPKNDVKEKFKELFKRIISSIILLPIVIYAILQGGYYFTTLITITAVILGFEWGTMTHHCQTRLWQISGILYISLPCLSMLWLINQNSGVGIVLSICVIVWATDTGAYIFGKLLGGPKLAPSISPNKTWSGFLGGLFLGCIAGFFRDEILFASIFISILSQIGDLLESYIKRLLKIKNSGNLMPGHGGLLDRVDGIIFVTPCVALYKLLIG